MKKVTIILTGVILMALYAINVNAQVSATAASTATIVTTIEISKDVDLNFGNIAVTNTGGTVTVPAETGSPIRSITGGVTLPSIAGTVTAAKFLVEGQEDYGYSITLPNQITLSSGLNTMIVDNFVTNKLSNTSSLDASGNDTFYVGATVNVSANQAPGEYSNSSDLTVTVNYN